MVRRCRSRRSHHYPTRHTRAPKFQFRWASTPPRRQTRSGSTSTDSTSSTRTATREVSRDRRRHRVSGERLGSVRGARLLAVGNHSEPARLRRPSLQRRVAKRADGACAQPKQTPSPRAPLRNVTISSAQFRSEHVPGGSKSTTGCWRFSQRLPRMARRCRGLLRRATKKTSSTQGPSFRAASRGALLGWSLRGGRPQPRALQAHAQLDRRRGA